MNFKKYSSFLLLFFFPLFSFSQSKEYKDSLALIAEMKSYAVFHDNFVRNTFYTWTTPEQIEVLRNSPKLLIKSKSETSGYSLFDVTIRDTTFKSFLIARLLQQPQFAKKRFAWTSCWPTSMGWENEKYGNQLIKIVLNDSAIIGCFNSQYLPDPFQFYDMKGNKLKTEYVIENSDRLAVMYHVNTSETTRTENNVTRNGTTFHNSNRYKKQKSYIEMREYVIFNNNMISWSYGTEEIKGEITKEVVFLENMKNSPYALQKGYSYDDECGLTKDTFSDELKCYFSADKCFNTDDYLRNKKRLQVIIDQLKLSLTQQSAPIVR